MNLPNAILGFLFLASTVLPLFVPKTISAQNIRPDECRVVTSDIPDFDCTDYTVPAIMGSWQYGDTDPGPGIHSPTCKREDQRVPDLAPGNTYRICCPKGDVNKTCSEYTLRTALCGSSQETFPSCTYDNVHGALVCCGNNYRRCDTAADFPSQDEGGPTNRAGYIGTNGQPTDDPGQAAQICSTTYNGVTYDQIPNCRVWVADGINCGLGNEQGGKGESRLWFPHLRLIAALSTIAQAIFNPEPSALVKNTPHNTGEASLKNPDVITTKIDKHQAAGEIWDVVDNQENNSTLIVGKEAPTASSVHQFTDDIYADSQCVIPEVINNPGDDLLGPTIKARALYTQEHSYIACASNGCALEGAEVNDESECCASPDGVNSGAPGYCIQRGSRQVDSSGRVTYICGGFSDVKFETAGKLNVFVKNPLVEYIYDTIVEGEDSLFSRFMPHFYTRDYQEIPSSVAYSVSATSENLENQTVAVDVAGGSSTPLFYVPHVGSLKKYWLEDLQRALRPQGILATANVGTPPETSTACNRGEENTTPPEVSVLIDSGLTPIEAAFIHASTKYKVPVCVLKGVAGLETGLQGYTGSNPKVHKNSVNWKEILADPEQERYLWSGNNEIVCDPGTGDEIAHNQCSARGPFQITTGPEGVYCKNTEPLCPYVDPDHCIYSCSSYCDTSGVVANRVPNAWTGGLYSASAAAGRPTTTPANFYDSLMGAAKILNQKAGSPSSASWNDSLVVSAGNNYYGLVNGVPPVVYGGMTYGQALNAYCKGQLPNLFP